MPVQNITITEIAIQAGTPPTVTLTYNPAPDPDFDVSTACDLVFSIKPTLSSTWSFTGQATFTPNPAGSSGMKVSSYSATQLTINDPDNLTQTVNVCFQFKNSSNQNTYWSDPQIKNTKPTQPEAVVDE